MKEAIKQYSSETYVKNEQCSHPPGQGTHDVSLQKVSFPHPCSTQTQGPTQPSQGTDNCPCHLGSVQPGTELLTAPSKVSSSRCCLKLPWAVPNCSVLWPRSGFPALSAVPRQVPGRDFASQGSGQGHIVQSCGRLPA